MKVLVDTSALLAVLDASVHDTAVAALLTARRRKLSLVDCVSFEVARRLAVKTAFAFDRHFAEQGFECLPARQ